MQVNQMPKFGWGKLVIFGSCVVLPAIAVGISNYVVFIDSFAIATILLCITVIVAGVFTYFSGDAIARVRRYCIFADIIIGAVLCVNLCAHFLLSREVSAAKDAVIERHKEEDRAEQFRTADADRQTKLLTAQQELAKVEATRLRQEAIRNDSARRLGFRIPNPWRTIKPAPAPTIAPGPGNQENAPESKAEAPAKVLTPDEVRREWQVLLNWLALLDCIVSVFAGLILAGVWQWDCNHDGIPDHLQNGMVHNPALATGRLYTTDANGRLVEVTAQDARGRIGMAPPIDTSQQQASVFPQRDPNERRGRFRGLWNR